MGDPDVSSQIEELKQQIRTEAERGRARMAGIEAKLGGLTEAFTTVATIAHHRGAAAGTGRPLTLVPDCGLVSVTQKRRRIVLTVVAAAALASLGIGVLTADSNPPAAPRGNSGPLIPAPGDERAHGPAIYPPTPGPSPVVTDINVSASPGAPRPGTAPAVGARHGVDSGRDPLTSEPSPLTPGRSPSTVTPDCRLGVQIRRIMVCRTAAK
jgi:hypothetical protein